MHDLNQREFRRILIIKPSSFGDVIHALPVLNGLRQRYPDAKISWLVANSCAGLLEDHPALDEIIRFDRKAYGHIGRSLQITGSFLRFLRELRLRKFDLVLDLQGLFRSGFLAAATRAPFRVGFANAREFGWIFYTHRVPVPDPEMHAVDRNYLFAKALGFDHVPLEFHLPVREEARRSVRTMLAAHGLNAGESYLLAGPGTRWETKLWPVEHFAATVKAIVREHGLRVVLIGMPDEVERARRVEELAGVEVINLAGKTSLQQLIALVDESVMVLMHDSGPMHLAMALNRPMVALYGPTNPQRTGPYRRPEAVARLDLPCSPCYLKTVAQCRYGHRCLRELTPESVVARVGQVLSEGVRS